MVLILVWYFSIHSMKWIVSKSCYVSAGTLVHMYIMSNSTSRGLQSDYTQWWRQWLLLPRWRNSMAGWSLPRLEGEWCSNEMYPDIIGRDLKDYLVPIPPAMGTFPTGPGCPMPHPTKPWTLPENGTSTTSVGNLYPIIYCDTVNDKLSHCSSITNVAVSVAGNFSRGLDYI